MSNPPSDFDPMPEFGWSLPPNDPAPTPNTVVPSQPPPMPPPRPPATTGFGAPPGAYLPGPTTSSPIDAVMPPPVPEPRPFWKQWWFVVALVVLLVGGGALLIVGRDDSVETNDTADTRDDGSDEDDPSRSDATIPDDTTPDDSTPDVTTPDVSISEITVPEITIPDISIPIISIPEIPDITLPGISSPDGTGSTTPIGDLPVVGETVTLDDGTLIRVDAVTPDAPAVQDFFEPDEDNVLTRIAFEACAGDDGFAALNPLYWAGTLADGSEASPFLFSFPIVVLELAPGSCVATQIDLESPADQVVTRVGVRDSLFQVAAEWSTASSVATDGPLLAPAPVARAALGTTLELAGGGTATVRSAVVGGAPLDPAYPPDPGFQYVTVDAEVCAASAPLAITALNFFGTTTTNQIGGASYYGSTFPAEPIPAGTCATGSFDVSIPSPGTPADIIVTNEQYQESGRWSVG